MRHCVQSVLNQTFQDFELIVTEDASTDDTVAVVRSFSDSLNYFRARKQFSSAWSKVSTTRPN